ncbi:hypothetical protein ACHHYP_20236 [Achlya hypogyna]|uniref:Uncharacterized protein n=1 Tax=Achlya hypogyna TaxID=1202772 RepID=A0A1V9YWL6_ACHHY|nr:hypothetical protein ACHHYP_20236 [Achlya hypogyna]
MQAPHVHLIYAPPTRWERLLEGAGIVYLVASLFSSYYCLVLFAPYLDNNFFWPDFDSSSSAMTSVVNSHLADVPPPSSIVVPHAYVVTSPLGTENPIYPRLVLHTDLTTVEAGIANLRRLDTSLVLYLMTSYCWADLDRRWSLAHTLTRQRRCIDSYTTNAAVHLEAVLRNTDLTAWRLQHEALFTMRIGAAVQVLPGGAAWLENIWSHSLATSATEATVWRQANLTYFDLAYSNRVTFGIQESVVVTNAFGYAKMFNVKSLATGPRGAWTTSYLLSVLAYDFVGPAANESLVRGSSTFFGTANPDCIQSYVLGSPLNAVQTVIYKQLGPLTTIDERWFSCNLGTGFDKNSVIFGDLRGHSQFVVDTHACVMESRKLGVLWRSPSLLKTSAEVKAR